MRDHPQADPTFVEIMTIHDESLLPIVHSILEESGIAFDIRNEQTQNLIGAAPRINPAVVMVDATRADEARERLAPLSVPLEEGADVEGAPD
jgi:hypothetical protein